MSRRAASIWAERSAIFAWIAWNLEIGWPNASPLLRVGDRLVERALGEADAHRRDADAAAVEDVEELLEAVAAPAEQVRSGTRQSSKVSGRVSEAFQPIFR